jgi:branched-chain amino acid transport system permease protein
MTSLLDTLRKNRTLLITLAVLFLLFLMAAQGMSTRDWVTTTLRGLAVGSITFLVAAGLSIILGLMDVLNLAHGTLFMIGAYIGWSMYVRPDTMVDWTTPLLLLIAGLILMPLWGGLVARMGLGRSASRVWPWVALALGLGLAALGLVQAPVAMWSASEYQDSPIVWTQYADAGTTSEHIQPATFEPGQSPVLVWGAILLGGVLIGVAIAGVQMVRRGGAEARARRPRSRALASFAVLIAIAAGVYLVNTPLTNALVGLNTTVLFAIAAVVAVLVGAGLGGLMEVMLIRPLYARPLYQIMLTFGLAFIGTEVVRSIWGRTGFTMPKPSLFASTGEGCPADSIGGWLQYHCSTLVVTIDGERALIRTYNEIFVILVGLVVLIAVWLLLQRSRLGMIIRAGVQDSSMVEALGINVRRIFTLVFALGVGLAAFGGVIAAPASGLSDSMGATLLLGSLIALAIGGLTSYPGAAAGAVIVGLVQQFIIKYGQIGINLPFLDEPWKPTPPIVPASTILLMIVILLVLPQGLFGRKE